jgi:hypothetical protein
VLIVNGSQSLSSVDDEALTTPEGSIGVHLARLNEATAEVRIWELSPTKTHEIRVASVVSNPPGDDVVGERVVLRSDRLRAASLQGWSLRDDKEHPASPPWRYVFPNVELAPGEDLTIWTKAGRNDSHNLFWGLNHAVWNNRGGDTAILSDSAGVEIGRFSY